MEMATLLLFCFSSCLCVYFLILSVKFFNKVWLNPVRIQSPMNRQGLKGPPYKFVYGNSREILAMINGIKNTPMELSHDIFPRIQPHVYTWINIYGMNILFSNGQKAEITVAEPDLVKEVMNNKDGGFPKQHIEGHAKKLLGDGLAISRGEKWSKMRKLANHAFSAEAMMDLVPAMVASAEMMLRSWKQEEGKEIDVVPEFTILTSEVISRTAFGSSHIEEKHIFDLLMKMGTIMLRNYYKIRIPVIGNFVK